MAEEKVVNLRVDDNIPATVNNLKQLKKELKATAAGSAEFNKISQQIRDMDDAIKDASASSDDFAGFLENASGPVGMLGGAIRGAEKTFSSFNGALKASIIGLIVGLVAGLVEAFQNNEKAVKKFQPVMQKMEQIFNGVYTVIEPLFDILINLAVEALPIVAKSFSVVYSAVTAVFQSIGALGGAIKKLIGGDFSGAWDDAKKSVIGFAKNYDDANKRFESGSKELTKSQKEELAKRKEDEKKHQDELQLKRDEAAKIKKAKEDEDAKIKTQKEDEAFQDESNLISEQLKATKLGFDEQRNLVNNDEKLKLEDRLAFLKQINLDELKSIEDHNKAIADLETKYTLDAQTRAAVTEQQKLDLAKKRELDDITRITNNADERFNLTNLLNSKYDALQLELDTQKEQDALKKKEDANLLIANKIDTDFALRIAAVQAREDAENSIIFKSEDEKTAYQAANVEARKKIAVDEKNHKLAIYEMIATAALQASEIVGKETAAGKTLAIAGATINTYLGITKALAGPFPFNLVAAATVGAAGFKAIKNILAVQVPSGGGGGAGASAGGGSVSQAPVSAAPQFNVVGTSGSLANQVQSVTKVQEPIKAYVVSKDVTSAQSLDRNIIKAATIA